MAGFCHQIQVLKLALEQFRIIRSHVSSENFDKNARRTRYGKERLALKPASLALQAPFCSQALCLETRITLFGLKVCF